MARKKAEKPDAGKHPFKAFSKWLKKYFKKNELLVIALILLAGAALFNFVIAPFVGGLAGDAVGAWHGVTDGIKKGAEEGRQAGLSAEDTKVKISTKMKEEAELEVLLTELKMTDLYKYGEGGKYAALLCLPGHGVYSVDLRNTQVIYTEEGGTALLLLTIPEPDFNYYPDDSGLEVVAEYPKTEKLLNGSSINGYQGYLNSRAQLEQKVQEEFSGDSAMMDQARELARNQVERLARSVCGSQAAVTVRFIGEE